MTPPSSRQRARDGTAPSSRAQQGRLSVDDWTDAALDLLVREGVSAVKISTLCEQLHVSKGSFYWHFESLADLFEAVAGRWLELTKQTLEAMATLADLPPAERVLRMTQRLNETASVERTVRDWARTDSRIAGAIAATDGRIFELVQQALLEHGLPPEDARLRAGLLLYAGIGFAHGAEALPRPTAEELVRLLDLVLNG